MEYFQKKGWHILHLNVNSLLPKIEKTRSIAKQSNASIIRISKSRLDSSILTSEVDSVGYDIIRMDRSRRGDRIACDITKSLSHYLIIISQVFVLTLKAFLQTVFCTNQSQFC